LPQLTAFLDHAAAPFHAPGDVGRNYEHARQLCRYLMERGALGKLIDGLRKARPQNPLGFTRKTCREALEVAAGMSVDALDADFRAWLGR